LTIEEQFFGFRRHQFSFTLRQTHLHCTNPTLSPPSNLNSHQHYAEYPSLYTVEYLTVQNI
jgi:hypothetical protein